MKKHVKLLSMLLVLVLLLSAMPALAAQDTDSPPAVEPVLKQVSAKINMYTGPGSNMGMVQALAKNTAVLAFETDSGFTRVQYGAREGYVSSKSLKALNKDVLLTGIVQANSNVTLLSTPDVKGKKVGQLNKGDILPSLLTIGDFTAVRQGSLAGFVATKSLTVYSQSSKSKGYLLYNKAADIKAGSASSDKKLASISAGDLVELLYTGASVAVVRQGNVIGVAPTKDATLYNDILTPTGTVQATKDTAILAGAKPKATKLGMLKKNETAEKLSEFGSYTVVRFDKVIGLVLTKDIVNVQKGLQSDTPNTATTVYPPITTKTVVVIAEDVSAFQSASASGKFIILSEGTECQYIETSKDGGWVKVIVGNDTLFIPRQYVAEPGALKGAKVNTPASTSSLPAVSYPDMALEFIDIMNSNRAAVGQKPLKVDDTLMRAAAIRANELVTSFSHKRPDGTDPNAVHNMITGENIARGPMSLLPDAQSMADGFMGSSEHKKIAMSGSYTKTGAYFVIDSASRIYWVQLFAH